MLSRVQDGLLTVPEVAGQLRIAPKTVRRWLREGKLRGVRLGGNKIGWRVSSSEVARLVSVAPVEAPRG